MSGIATLPIENPVLIFFIVLVIILFAPILLNRIRVPHIIGLIIAGVIIGPNGLNLLARDSSFEISETWESFTSCFWQDSKSTCMISRKAKKTESYSGCTRFSYP